MASLPNSRRRVTICVSAYHRVVTAPPPPNAILHILYTAHNTISPILYKPDPFVLKYTTSSSSKGSRTPEEDSDDHD